VDKVLLLDEAIDDGLLEFTQFDRFESPSLRSMPAAV
jgi:hypothetical protein